MKINVIVSEPEELGNGVYRTSITHHLLDGELSFTHSTRNRDLTLGAITNSLADDVKEIIEKVQDLRA
jgi:hypothetical protein